MIIWYNNGPSNAKKNPSPNWITGHFITQVFHIFPFVPKRISYILPLSLSPFPPPTSWFLPRVSTALKPMWPVPTKPRPFSSKLFLLGRVCVRSRANNSKPHSHQSQTGFSKDLVWSLFDLLHPNLVSNCSFCFFVAIFWYRINIILKKKATRIWNWSLWTWHHFLDLNLGISWYQFIALLVI